MKAYHTMKDLVVSRLLHIRKKEKHWGYITIRLERIIGIRRKRFIEYCRRNKYNIKIEDVYPRPLYITARLPLPTIFQQHTTSYHQPLLNGVLHKEKLIFTPLGRQCVYDLCQQTSDDIPYLCLTFSPPRWGLKGRSSTSTWSRPEGY